MELKEKVIKASFLRLIFEIIGLLLFAYGIVRHDWFMFLGGVYLLLDYIQIIHYNGIRYE